MCACVAVCLGVSGTIFSGALSAPTKDSDALSRIRCIISTRLSEVSKNHGPAGVSYSSFAKGAENREFFHHPAVSLLEAALYGNNRT